MDNFTFQLELTKLEYIINNAKEYNAPWLQEKGSVCRNDDGSFASCSDVSMGDKEDAVKSIPKLNSKSLTINQQSGLAIKQFFNTDDFDILKNNLNNIGSALKSVGSNINNGINEILDKGKELFNKENYSSTGSFIEQTIKEVLENKEKLSAELIAGNATGMLALNAISEVSILSAFSLNPTGLGIMATAITLGSLPAIVDTVQNTLKKKKIADDLKKDIKDVNSKLKEEAKAIKYASTFKREFTEEDTEFIQKLKDNKITKPIFNENLHNSQLGKEVIDDLEIESSEDLIEMGFNLRESGLDIIQLINNSIEDKKYSPSKNQFDLPYRMKSLNDISKKRKLSKREKRLKEVHENILKADIEYGDYIRKSIKLRNLEEERREAISNRDWDKMGKIKKLLNKAKTETPFKELINNLEDKSSKNHIDIKPLDGKLTNLPIPEFLKNTLGKEEFDKRSLQLYLKETWMDEVPELSQINLNEKASSRSKDALSKFNDLIGKDLNITLADIETRGRAFQINLEGRSLLKINTLQYYSDNSRRRVIFHEGSHAIEAQNPDILERSKEFLFDRAKKIWEEQDRDYKLIKALKSKQLNEEYAIDGGFSDSYTGKIYSSQPFEDIFHNGISENKVNASEILSMGVQSLAYRQAFEKHIIKDKDHVLYSLSAIHDLN